MDTAFHFITLKKINMMYELHARIIGVNELHVYQSPKNLFLGFRPGPTHTMLFWGAGGNTIILS